MRIYVDESGDLGSGKGTKYFVIGMVFCDESRVSQINAIINKHNRYLWNNGWPKRLEIKATNLYNYKSHFREIGANAPKINPKCYLHKIYKDINQMDIKAGFLIHDPTKEGSILRNLHNERIYNFLSKQLYQACLSYLESPLFICVDQRNIALARKQRMVNRSAQKVNLSYIGYIENEIVYQFATKYHIGPEVAIEFGDSKRVKGLQVADYLAWAIRRKYEGRPFWGDLVSNVEKIEQKDNF